VSKQAFDKIAAGLNEALAQAQAPADMISKVALALAERDGCNCDYFDLARAAIEAYRDNLTEPMRYAVWFDQYKHHGATDEEARQLATKRVEDDSQRQQDISAHRAMADAALRNRKIEHDE